MDKRIDDEMETTPIDISTEAGRKKALELGFTEEQINEALAKAVPEQKAAEITRAQMSRWHSAGTNAKTRARRFFNRHFCSVKNRLKRLKWEPEEIKEWLENPNGHLTGMSPEFIIVQGRGDSLVEWLDNRIEAGADIA